MHQCTLHCEPVRYQGSSTVSRSALLSSPLLGLQHAAATAFVGLEQALIIEAPVLTAIEPLLGHHRSQRSRHSEFRLVF